MRNIKLVLLFILITLISACSEDRTVLEEIIDSGKLRFAILGGPATYIRISKQENIGFEYELAKKFADDLGVDLKTIVVTYAHEIIPMVEKGKAIIGAAGLVDGSAVDNLQSGPGYNEATQQLVYRYASRRPMSVDDIRYGDLIISPTLQHMHLMKDIELQHPQFSWLERKNKRIDTLLNLVNNEEIIATVANSSEVAIYKHLYPDIRVAFNITQPQPHVWIYRKHRDNSLHNAVLKYFDKIKNNGDLDKLMERYFGHLETFDYVDIRTYLERVEGRLPKYETLFKQVAKKYNLDWTLLAAQSYQESHWNPKARSPTGVRGLMMLTQDTAKRVEINNRLDPKQSVEGGARYFNEILSKIPDRITEPDRTWFALAAYNVGFEHLEDARKLAENLGGDPDSWLEVRQRLPLLSEEKWYKQTQYGFARGNEPVIYVENIRRYRDILNWIKYWYKTSKQKSKLLQAFIIDSPVF